MKTIWHTVPKKEIKILEHIIFTLNLYCVQNQGHYSFDLKRDKMAKSPLV